MKYVLRRALVCALIGFSLAMIGCGKMGINDLPAPDSLQVSVTTDYKAVVQIILPNGQGLCTGTFVSPRAVLTASHCTSTNGSYTIMSSYGTFTTSSKVRFGSGTVDDDNDIAILYFSSDVITAIDGYAKIGTSVSKGDTVRIVGYGCNSLTTKSGSGVKRTGTNVVYNLGDYIELITPDTTSSYSARSILGASNRAGSCFGDSGGFLGKPTAESNGQMVVLGATHAGGTSGGNIISQFIDLTRSDNRNFISQANANYSLGIGL